MALDVTGSMGCRLAASDCRVHDGQHDKVLQRPKGRSPILPRALIQALRSDRLPYKANHRLKPAMTP